MAGIVLRDRDGEERVEQADLIADASGRASEFPKWLANAGFGQVPEERITVGLRYATARFRRSTARDLKLKAAIVGASKLQPRGGIAQAVEDDILQVSMAEYADAPPTTVEEFVEYAKTLPQPDLYDWMQGAEPIDGIRTQRIEASYRRYYHRMRLPEGFVAVGDAVCAFNPVYAQGMTVAAVEAELLGEQLAKGKRKLTGRYFRAIRGVTDITWQIGSTNDLGLEQVQGKRTLATRLIGSWINRVQEAGTVDPYIAERFIRVAALLDAPTSLLTPMFAVRVLLTKKSGHEDAVLPGQQSATAAA